MKTLSNPPCDDSWLQYHKEMTDRYDYFVRGDMIKPFYTNSELHDLKQQPGDFIDVFNCNWIPNNWHIDPYQYRFTAVGNKYEWFAQHDTLIPNNSTFNLAGLRKNDQWIEMYYKNIRPGSNDSTVAFGSDGFCSVRHRGILFKRNTCGKWYKQAGLQSTHIDRPPVDVLTVLARQMNNSKWKGFYSTIISFLVSEGVNRTQI